MPVVQPDDIPRGNNVGNPLDTLARLPYITKPKASAGRVLEGPDPSESIEESDGLFREPALQ